MADDQTTTATPDPSTVDPALLQQLLRQTLNPQPVQLAQPQASTSEGRSTLSLLGEALGGGQQYGSPAEREMGGLAALGAMGRSMLQGSDYSYQRHSLGSIIGQGMGAAGEALASRQSVSAAQQAANLDYQQKQQEMQLARIKEAVPLLTLQQNLARLKAATGMPNPLAGTMPTSIGAAGTGGIGAVGAGEAPINAAGDSATRKASEGGPPAPGTPAAAVAQQVHDFWISKGFSEPVVAGIMAGGPGSESNFDPTASGDKATSLGLYQHHAERLDGMRKFFNLSADQMPTADQQNQYAAWEISPQGPKAAVGAALQTAKTPAEAAAIWTRSFGVPADKTEIGRRAAGAGRFEGIYAKPQDTAPGAPAASTDAQALPVPPIPPAQPPGVSGTPLPAGRPTGPPIITDQPPAGSATVAGPPGAATLGQPLPPSPAVAGDVGAIIGGMTGAGASPTTLAPGPGTAAPTSPPPAIVAAATPQAPVPPAIVQPQPQPPAAATKPDADLTFEEYRDRHGYQPTAAERSSWQITPDAKALADAGAAQQAAAQQLQLARGGMGDADKALATYNVATDAVNKLRQEAQIQTANNQRDWFAKRDEMLAANYRAARAEAAATALKTQEGQQAIDIEKVKAGQTWRQKLQEQAATYAQDNTIKPMAASSAKAHQMNLGLSQMIPILQDLPPSGGPLGSVLEAHPDLAPLLKTAGVLDDKQADAVRLINGLVSNISTEMKPQGLGALREYEWDAFKSQLPGMLTTKDGQLKAVALLMNMNNRIQQEHSWMSSYFSRKIPDETNPNKTVTAHNLESDDPKESVQMRMDRELGPIIPSVPPGTTSQAQWEQSLRPGQPYYKSWLTKDPQNPGQPLRNSDGSPKTHTTLEVRPWQ